MLILKTLIMIQYLIRWVDDNSTVDDSFTNWNTYQPDEGEDANCMAMFGSNGEWYDEPCTAEWYAVCSKTIATTTATTTTTTMTTSSTTPEREYLHMELSKTTNSALILAKCPESPDCWAWDCRLNHCHVYYFSNLHAADSETPVASWKDSYDICTDMNATLARIHSQYENDFITEEIDGHDRDIWIGATDAEEEGIWM